MRSEEHNAVEVEDLTRTFGDFVAVDRVSFTVRKGEIFGFLGPNGAGKSTTIKLLNGLLVPSSGRGAVGGYDIMTETEQIKKTIGYMSQKFSLYDDLTVEENIDFFSGIYNVPKGKADERKAWSLAMAGLDDRRDALTKTLPGGFKQRLALGCAVLHEPPILFLDEPTSGVDPLSRRAFWNLIYEMSRGGTTVFVTTHYMDEAEYCDRLALLYRGTIIAKGTPDELKQEHMKRDILEVDADPFVDAMELLDRQGFETALFGSILHVTVEDAGAALPEIERLLAAAGIRVKRIERIAPSLEDVFVTLIETA